MNPAKAWNDNASDLADWALARFFVRTDRYGGYFLHATDGVRKVASPKDVAVPNCVTRSKLLKHFRATRTGDVVGAFSLAPEPGCVGRCASADIDAHDADADPELNRRYGEHLYFNLAVMGFRPLLATWGAGSYHLHAVFDRDVAGDVLHRFGRWLVSDAREFGFNTPVESYPKQSVVPEGKYGNWLRVVGRHHTRDVWASVFDGSTWREGASAVEHVLSLTGDHPDLIPLSVVTPEPERQLTHSTPGPCAGPRDNDPADVFSAFNSASTMQSIGELLEQYGWKPAGRRGERWDYTRPGKGGDKSGNLMLSSGMPLFYGFTNNGGIPDHRGLNPTQLRAALEFSGHFGRLAEQLRTEGYGAPRINRPTATGAPPDAPPPAQPVAADDPAPRTGATIILDHFRATYRPDFRRGNAIHTAAGELVPMSVAISVPTSALITRLEDAVDAPRDRHGGLVRQSLPRFFSNWSKVAWGDLLKVLPEEDGAKLGAGDAAGQQFRALVKAALLSQIVLGNQIGARNLDITQTERRSVIGWCKKMGVAGPWRSIRDYQIWAKTRGAGPDVTLMVAIRHELFGQLKSDRLLCDLTANSFTRRCEQYGIGSSSRDERPGGKSAVLLDTDFVLEMTTGLPEGYGSDNYPEFWSGSEKPNSGVA